MHHNILRNQLLDKIHSPLLDASISTAILKCGWCKNFRATHLHSLLEPIMRRRPFELLVGDYLSMPNGKGGFTKIGLYADVFSQKLWAYKSKTMKGKDTVNSLQHISQAFVAPTTFMADEGPYFNCHEVKDFCESIRTHLHIVASYSPWINGNGLLEQSDRILLDALKYLCAPDLGEDDFEKMATKDILKSWPDHLETTIKNLSDHILPSLKFSPNKLLLGVPTTIPPAANPEDILPPTKSDILLHLMIAEQQHLDGCYSIDNPGPPVAVA